MITLSCPSCGAEVVFRSKASVFAVCSFCKSTLVRQDMNLDLLGKMAELQDDPTPLQVGTKGTFSGQTFELIGRLKVAYDDGSWNEWYAMFGGDKVGWLAEAQGFYAVCFPFEGRIFSIPREDEIMPKTVVDLSPQGKFQVEDMREVHCVYSEGELPMNAVKGRKSLSVDLADHDGGMATIEYADPETRVFIGEYVEFDDLQFQNLRHIDGW